MKKIVFAIMLWALASCTGQRGGNAPEAKDSYAGLWSMLVLSGPPDIKPLKENANAVFKDASRSTGKGKIAVGTS